jgi:hypothetical protein
MNRFFVPNEIYEDRIAICKACTHYFKLTGNCLKCGCFVKVKSRISVMSCPINKWTKTTEVEIPKELPKEIVEEILDMWKDLKTGRAKNVAAKKRMIETYNTIYNTNYGTGTSCGSCLSTCYDGIKKLYYEYSKDN